MIRFPTETEQHHAAPCIFAQRMHGAFQSAQSDAEGNSNDNGVVVETCVIRRMNWSKKQINRRRSCWTHQPIPPRAAAVSWSKYHQMTKVLLLLCPKLKDHMPRVLPDHLDERRQHSPCTGYDNDNDYSGHNGGASYDGSSGHTSSSLTIWLKHWSTLLTFDDCGTTPRWRHHESAPSRSISRVLLLERQR